MATVERMCCAWNADSFDELQEAKVENWRELQLQKVEINAPPSFTVGYQSMR